MSRTTSAGLWRFANEYAAAGSLVAGAAKGSFSHPAYFLYGRSIELALKAFLLARGVPYDELRKRSLGHDLVALMKRAKRHRLGQFVKVSPREMKALELLNAQYATKQLEYIDTGTFSVPQLFSLQLFTHQMIGALKTFCIRSALASVRP